MPEQRKTIKAAIDLTVEILNRMTGFATIILAIAMIVRSVYHEGRIEKKIDDHHAASQLKLEELKQLIIEKMGKESKLWDEEFLKLGR